MKKYLTIFSLTLFLGVLRAQDVEKIRELKEKVSFSSDSIKANALNDWCWLIRTLQPDSAIVLAISAINLSQRIHYPRGLAAAYKNMASILRIEGKYTEALDYCKKAESICYSLKDSVGSANIINLSGLIYWARGDFYHALEKHRQAFELFTKIKNPEGQVKTLSNQGIILYEKGNYAGALEYFLQALKLNQTIKKNNSNALSNIYLNIGLINTQQRNHKEALAYYQKSYDVCVKNNDISGTAHAYSNIGVAYNNLGENSKSLEFHIKSKKQFERLGDKHGVAFALSNIGVSYLQKESYADALDFYLQSLKIRREIGDVHGIAIVCINISQVYLLLHQYPTSISYANIALEKAEETGSVKYKRDANFQLATIYEEKKDFITAYSFFKEYNTLNDSLFNSKKNEEINRIKYEYQTEERKKELELQTEKIKSLMQEKKFEGTINYFLLAAVVLIIVGGFLFLKWQRNKLKSEKQLVEKNLQINRTLQELTETELQNSRLESHLLNDELDFKNKELTDFAIHIVEKNEFLENLKQRLKKAKDNSKIEKEGELIHSISMEIKNNLNIDRERKEFEMHIEEANSNFYKKLKEGFPSLSENEIRLSALLRLNLSSKDIATILNINPKSVDMNRYRLRKRFNLGPESNLSAFLTGL
jgi:tetratricopeptide (TPR) repeat protein